MVLGKEKKWSSWTDDVCPSWYEAEKILPHDVYDISVCFMVQSIGDTWDVCKVDRHNHCCWVSGGENEECVPEIFRLRVDDASAVETVDATFELAGPMYGSYVSRAWNASESAPNAWECWDDEESRPQSELRLATLRAADAVALPIKNVKSSHERAYNAALRYCAAVAKLAEIHRHTLETLRALDEDCNAQWLAINSTNTVAAGLAIGSAVAVFTLPPLGIGLGIASALTSGATATVDASLQRTTVHDLRQQTATDVLNSFAVAELFKEWVKACDASGISSDGDASSRFRGRFIDAVSPACVEDEGFSTENSLRSVTAVGTTATTAAWSGAQVGSHLQTAAVTLQVSYIFGSVMATGMAVHGWCSTKFGQQEVRDQISELETSLLHMQDLLASVDQLECSRWLEDVGVQDEVRHCTDSLHFVPRKDDAQ